MQTNSIGTKERAALKCPVCKSPELRATDLEAGLTFFNCPECRGNWLRVAQYWKWLQQHGPNLPQRSDQDSGLSLVEPDIYIDCPECRFFLVMWRAASSTRFPYATLVRPSGAPPGRAR